MSDKPTSPPAASLLSAVSSLNHVHMSARSLNEDIRELLEQTEMVHSLPESINLCQVDGWKTRLLSKLRMEISNHEEQYRIIVDSEWAELLKTIKRDGPAMPSISFSFPDDMRIMLDFYSEIHRTASSNDLFTTSIRAAIPMLPFGIEKAICRIISDIKTMYS